MPYKNYELQKEFQRIYGHKKSAVLRELKNKPCMDCAQSFHPCVMEWDHRPGTDKFKGVGNMTRYSLERCLKEIAKCDLVCSNCHRIRTFNRRKLKENNHL